MAEAIFSGHQDLVDRITCKHLKYCQDLQTEYMRDPDVFLPDRFRDPETLKYDPETTIGYSILLREIIKSISIDDLIKIAEKIDLTSIDSFRNSSWICRHLLELYINSSHRFSSIDAMKSTLSPEEMSRIYLELHTNLLTYHPQPKFRKDVYRDLRQSAWMKWRSQAYPSLNMPDLGDILGVPHEYSEAILNLLMHTQR